MFFNQLKVFMKPIRSIYKRNQSTTLAYKSDLYNGVHIDEQGLSSLTSDEFSLKLQHSLDQWKQQSHRGVWLKLSLQNSSFIPIAIKSGFTFHHAGFIQFFF